MNFKVLKNIIAIFKKKLRCKECKSSISNKNIFVKSVTSEKVLLRCTCQKCGTILHADIAVMQGLESTPARQHRGLQLKAKKNKKVTTDDVLDIKNFLKSFKGDFKDIFENKQ